MSIYILGMCEYSVSTCMKMCECGVNVCVSRYVNMCIVNIHVNVCVSIYVCVWCECLYV